MQNDKKTKNERDLLFIDSLTDALALMDKESSEEVREELTLEGIDPDISTKKLIEYAHRCSMDAKRKQLDHAASMRKRIETQSEKSAGRFTTLSKEEIMKKIKDYLASPVLAPSFSYRDLNKRSREDLEAILEDLEAAQSMASVDGDNE